MCYPIIYQIEKVSIWLIDLTINHKIVCSMYVSSRNLKPISFLDRCITITHSIPSDFNHFPRMCNGIVLNSSTFIHSLIHSLDCIALQLNCNWISCSIVRCYCSQTSGLNTAAVLSSINANSKSQNIFTLIPHRFCLRWATCCVWVYV